MWFVTPKELKARTEEFARVVVVFCTPLLDAVRTTDLAGQLLRAGTGLDSNYGSAQLARSPDEFVAKMGQVVDDASESRGWLRLFNDSKLAGSQHLPWLLREADELTRIFAKSYRTARENNIQRKEAAKASRNRRNRRSPRGSTR